VRIIRYIVGDWVINKIKSSVKWIAHFYLERCNQFFKFVLAIVFLIVIPIAIAFASGLFEVLEFWFEELDNSF